MLSKIFIYVHITLPNKVHSVFIKWRFIVITAASVHRTSRYSAGAKYETLTYLSTSSLLSEALADWDCIVPLRWIIANNKLKGCSTRQSWSYTSYSAIICLEGLRKITNNLCSRPGYVGQISRRLTLSFPGLYSKRTPPDYEYVALRLEPAGTMDARFTCASTKRPSLSPFSVNCSMHMAIIIICC
jgi:hypothetical protein